MNKYIDDAMASKIRTIAKKYDAQVCFKGYPYTVRIGDGFRGIAAHLFGFFAPDSYSTFKPMYTNEPCGYDINCEDSITSIEQYEKHTENLKKMMGFISEIQPLAEEWNKQI